MGMVQNVSATESFVENILNNPKGKGYVIQTSYPYKKALSKNPNDGSNGILQEKKIMSNKGVLEIVIYKSRICKNIVDEFPYEIIFPKDKIGYFRKNKKSPWKKTKYLLGDKSHKYFPKCKNN